jgi:hypothetical protein
MKVLVFVKATPNSEKGVFPPDAEKLFADMGRFNEELVKAGIMQDADGLKPSRAGRRIRFSDSGATTVVDGPFAETKELVAGYWVWNVKSLDEAVEWARRCPNPMPGEEGVLEIRPVYTLEDFGHLVAEEDLEQEKRRRKQLKQKQKSGSKPPRAAKSAPRKTRRRARAKK